MACPALARVGCIAGCQQPVQSGAVGVNTLRHLTFVIFSLSMVCWTCQATAILEGDGAGFFKDALFLEDFIKGRSDMLIALVTTSRLRHSKRPLVAWCRA